MLKPEQVAAIRRMTDEGGSSEREVARALGISRNTVRRYGHGAACAAPRRGGAQRSDKVTAALPRAREIVLRWRQHGHGGRLTVARLQALLQGGGVRLGRTTVWKLLRAVDQFESG